MQTVPFNLPGSNPERKHVSILGLGCASMLGRVGRRDSLNALSAAYDAGITFYDTARSYGYGECEELLGDFFKGARRDSVVLCTKFGILPASPNSLKNHLKPIARGLLSIAPQLRSTVRRHAATQLNPGQFSLDTLASSFETSLRKLKTDYVDILLMHSPPLTAMQSQDLLDSMSRLAQSGKTRMIGISTGPDLIKAVFGQRSPDITAAQFPLNPLTMNIAAHTASAAESLFLIANQVFGGTEGIARSHALIDRLRQDPTLPEDLRVKLDDRDSSLLPDLILNCVLQGTGVSVAVPSMLEPRHLKANLRAIERSRFSSPELQLIRNTFASFGADSAVRRTASTDL